MFLIFHFLKLKPLSHSILSRHLSLYCMLGNKNRRIKLTKSWLSMSLLHSDLLSEEKHKHTPLITMEAVDRGYTEVKNGTCSRSYGK